METAIEYATAHLPGRMSGMNPDASNRNPVGHLVPMPVQLGDMGPAAVCGAKPGRRSFGWVPAAVYLDDVCPRCLKRAKQDALDKFFSCPALP